MQLIVVLAKYQIDDSELVYSSQFTDKVINLDHWYTTILYANLRADHITIDCGDGLIGVAQKFMAEHTNDTLTISAIVQFNNYTAHQFHVIFQRCGSTSTFNLDYRPSSLPKLLPNGKQQMQIRYMIKWTYINHTGNTPSILSHSFKSKVMV